MSPAAPLLAFDTSGPYCAAHLWLGTGTAVDRFEEMKTGQAERLVPLLNEMLEEAALGWEQLTAVAVGVGPGNFTGVRIAVATARAISLARGIPAVGITGFERISHGFDFPSRVLVSLPAPRRQAYVQPFENAAPQEPPRLMDIGVCESALEDRNLFFAGYEAEALATPYGAGWSAEPFDADEPARISLRIAEIARTKLAAANGPWSDRPKPLYVRPADAAPPADPPPTVVP